MSIHTIFNRLFGRGEPKQGRFHDLSFMKDIRESASLKTSDDMPLEERMEHARIAGLDIERSRIHLRQS